ncbi:siderophore ABC transporter substrate-binding protein [Microlunatus lacustris]
MSCVPRAGWAVAAVAALSLTLAACGGEATPAATDGGETVSITDAQNRTVEVPVKPETVVVTDWSALRTLTDLGIEADAVPTANAGLPADLARYAGDEVTKVGTLFELDYEAINALEPDLVIVGSRSGTPEVVEELTKITPAVVDLSARAETPADLVPAIEERVTQIGQIFGVEEQAAQQMTEAESAIGDVRTKAEGADLTAMFVQVSGGKASAYGPTSRFGTIFSDFGLADTGAPVDEEGSHGEEVGAEFFAEYNPGAIFVLDRGKAIGQAEQPALEVLQNDLVDRTDAAKNDKLVEVDGFSWYLASAAPSSLRQMAADVDRAF